MIRPHCSGLAPQGWLQADGKRLEFQYLPADDSTAPTLVLLHEGLGCLSLWKDFPQRLAETTGYGVFVYSRAGYGRSDPVELPRPLSYMHHEGEIVLPELLAAAGLEKPILVGHSDGASIALIAAGSGAVVCQSLVLIAPHVFNEAICVASIHEAGERYRQADLRERLARYHGARVDNAFWGWHDAWLDPDFWHWNIESYLSDVKVPTLLIQGEQDQYGSVAQLEAIEAQVSGPVNRFMIPDCGHGVPLEQPEPTLLVIDEFFRHRH